MGRRGGVLPAVLVALGTAVSVGPLATPASACSCVGLTDAQAFDRADAVFVGTLESRTVEDRTTSFAPAVHTFAVSEVRKGTALPRQEVVSAASGASCGLELSGNGPFLVTARSTWGGYEPRPGPGQLVTGLCDGTRALTAAEVAALSPLASPAAGGPATPTPSPENPEGVDGPLVLLTFATGAGVLGFLMILRRERRKRKHAR
jgi:hypothetical protein